MFSRLKQEYNITHFYYHTTEGINFLRVHQVDRFGDDINRRATMREAIQTGELSFGVELGPLGTLTLRVVAPLHVNNEIVGYIELGEDVDHLLPETASALSLNMFLLIDKSFLNRSDWITGNTMLQKNNDWNELESHVIASKNTHEFTSLLESIVRETCRGANTYQEDLINNRFLSCQVRNFIDAAGLPIGKLILIDDLSARMLGVYHTQSTIVVIVVIALGFLYYFFYILLGRIEKRLLTSQQSIIDSNKRLQRHTEGTPLAVIEWKPDFEICNWNSSAHTIFGYKKSEAIGKNLIDLLFNHDESTGLEKLKNPDTSFMAIDHTFEEKDITTCEWYITHILSETKESLGGCAFIHDVTAAKRLEKQASRTGRILENSWNEVYTFDANTFKFIHASRGAIKNTEYTLAELTQLSILDLVHDFSKKELEAILQPLKERAKSLITLETEFHRKSQSSYPVEIRIQFSGIESPPVFFCISNDISERIQHIAALEHKALYDPLTGLPNRVLLLDRLEHDLKLAARENTLLAILIIDIVRLREINDVLGYHNGDNILKEVAKRLESAHRASDTVARLAGDEFVILIGVDKYEDIAIEADKIQSLFTTQFPVDNSKIAIEVTIGISIFPYHGTSTSHLLQHADVATRLSKAESASFNIYDPKLDPFSLRQLELYSQLKLVVEQGRLSIYCQPKVNIKTKKVISIEILSRWEHSSEGLISPTLFIPMIEMSGLIRPFTKWLLEEVIKQLREWLDSGLEIVTAVNLSTRNLLDLELVDFLESLLVKYDVSPSYLTLEVTESAIMSRPETAEKILREIHSKGIMLSIDDFGTGYSSLAYLKRLPVHELKVDQSFVFGVTTDSNDAVIVKSTIELAHNLGLTTVAEGVESKEIYLALEDLGCDIAQGYYISRPFPVKELTQWLTTSGWNV